MFCSTAHGGSDVRRSLNVEAIGRREKPIANQPIEACGTTTRRYCRVCPRLPQLITLVWVPAPGPCEFPYREKTSSIDRKALHKEA
jgi:hypothetical protein